MKQASVSTGGPLPTREGTILDGIKTALLALFLVSVWYWLQGDILINLADEGFLWYGTERTATGDVPMRDFQSYYPGRYYWGALWSRVLGNGILALRLSTWIFGAVGLTLGLLVLRRVIRSWWMLALFGVLLLIWMYPCYKIFEPSIAMVAVYFGVLLLEKPSLLRHLAVGIFIGTAAFFGRNHGFYGFCTFLSLILFIWLKIERNELPGRIAAWCAGICVGFAGMILMIVLIPGYFAEVVDSITILFRIKGTNLTLPIPWPWKITLHPDIMETLSSISTAMLFLTVPLSYVGLATGLVFPSGQDLKRKAPLVAGLFVGIGYMHYMFSRADFDHLALAIHPFLLAVLSLPFLLKRGYGRVGAIGAVAFLFLTSFFSAGVASPFYIKAAGLRGPLTKVDIRGDGIWMSRYSAGLIRSVRKINRETVGQGQKLLIAPHWTTFYPILERESPLRDIYFLFKETEARQKQMIAELDEKGVHWVILGDIALDGRDDLRFRSTHHLLWKHIMDHFEPVEAEGFPSNYQLLKRK